MFSWSYKNVVEEQALLVDPYERVIKFKCWKFSHSIPIFGEKQRNKSADKNYNLV